MNRFPSDETLWTAEQRAVAETFRKGPRGAIRGPFLPLLSSPALADRVGAVGAHLRYASVLPDDVRELATLVTAAHWRSAYEWQAHHPLALKAGVPADLLDALWSGAAIADAPAPLALTLEIAGAVHAGGAIGDALFERGRAAFGEAGLIELVVLCGYYTLLAMVLNIAEPAT
ncbi:MAG TPA: carboxymuconolactone decarboxylase family protein [Xanthobacteraceae bacterium]|nr:carboxymuconolactone decarboxylase family protein [Xanthobacteraceae bacterium]